MKKNNKGVTLVELVVSFVLVSVAVIYFYQTLYTVKKLYTKSRNETNKFVEINYTFRLLDEKIEHQLSNTEFQDEDLCNNSEKMSGRKKRILSNYLFSLNDEILSKYKITSCYRYENYLKLQFNKCKDDTCSDVDEIGYNYIKYINNYINKPISNNWKY